MILRDFEDKLYLRIIIIMLNYNWIIYIYDIIYNNSKHLFITFYISGII